MSSGTLAEMLSPRDARFICRIKRRDSGALHPRLLTLLPSGSVQPLMLASVRLALGSYDLSPKSPDSLDGACHRRATSLLLHAFVNQLIYKLLDRHVAILRRADYRLRNRNGNDHNGWLPLIRLSAGLGTSRAKTVKNGSSRRKASLPGLTGCGKRPRSWGNPRKASLGG